MSVIMHVGFMAQGGSLATAATVVLTDATLLLARGSNLDIVWYLCRHIDLGTNAPTTLNGWVLFPT